ncbi:hypothetical protein ROZALSC1DRAFT_25846 [Rozella allomycis CSF55]|uniref:Uncharacterized protein n=1 Tax=Rozella allomycis (strain CSF55) TaxID=988480 RepID=A0A4P9YA11_ROZAC|nr:hypothetical protein ROZALSC1DRAFT_25846 [Rozella allomycis CSF55]
MEISRTSFLNEGHLRSKGTKAIKGINSKSFLNFFKLSQASKCGEGSLNHLRSDQGWNPHIILPKAIDKQREHINRKEREFKEDKEVTTIVIDEDDEIVKRGVQCVEKEIEISKNEGDEGSQETWIEAEFDKLKNERENVLFEGLIIEDDEGGVDVVMGPESNQIETKVEEGGVMESSGVAERDMDKMKFEDDEGGVDVLMGSEFDQIETEVEK